MESESPVLQMYYAAIKELGRLRDFGEQHRNIIIDEDENKIVVAFQRPAIFTFTPPEEYVKIEYLGKEFNDDEPFGDLGNDRYLLTVYFSSIHINHLPDRGANRYIPEKFSVKVDYFQALEYLTEFLRYTYNNGTFPLTGRNRDLSKLAQLTSAYTTTYPPRQGEYFGTIEKFDIE